MTTTPGNIMKSSRKDFIIVISKLIIIKTKFHKKLYFIAVYKYNPYIVYTIYLYIK